MESERTTHQQVYYQALGAVIDAEAALGADPHPIVRSITGANAVIAAVICELLSAPGFWGPEQLRELLAVVEDTDRPSPALAAVPAAVTTGPCGVIMGSPARPRYCRLPAGHDGFHSFLEPVA